MSGTLDARQQESCQDADINLRIFAPLASCDPPTHQLSIHVNTKLQSSYKFVGHDLMSSRQNALRRIVVQKRLIRSLYGFESLISKDVIAFSAKFQHL